MQCFFPWLFLLLLFRVSASVFSVFSVKFRGYAYASACSSFRGKFFCSSASKLENRRRKKMWEEH
jgi:hypothetical protein